MLPPGRGSQFLVILVLVIWMVSFLAALVTGIVARIKISASEGRLKGGGFVFMALVLDIVWAIILVAIAIPSFIEPKKSSNEYAAIESLKAISTAQTHYREADKDRNDTKDFAQSLSDLSTHDELIDPELSKGTKQGYIFSITRRKSSPTLQWNCTARPEFPGTSGDKYFYIDETGVIRFEANKMADCNSPAIGR
jgi:hypothetical protein